MCALPDDVKQICLWLVRGYGRRKAAALNGDSLASRERERMEAVEQALVAVGTDIPSEDAWERMRRSILLNVENGRANPYERLGLEAASRSDFYRRKDRFLADIAARLDLV